MSSRRRRLARVKVNPTYKVWVFGRGPKMVRNRSISVKIKIPIATGVRVFHLEIF